MIVLTTVQTIHLSQVPMLGPPGGLLVGLVEFAALALAASLAELALALAAVLAELELAKLELEIVELAELKQFFTPQSSHTCSSLVW